MWRIFFVGVMGLSLASVAVPQESSDQAAVRRKILAQKLINQIADAIDQSRKQDPKNAKLALHELLERVRESQDLSPVQQQQLVQRLRARIAAINNVRPEQIKPNKPVEVAKRWQDSVRESQKEIAELLRRHKDGIGIAAGLAASIAGPSAKERDLIRARENSPNGVSGILNRDRDRAAIIGGVVAYADIPPEIIFPPGPRPGQKNLTNKEKKLLKTLNSVLSVDFEKQKLKSVIEDVEKKTGLDIKIDEDALRDAGVDLNKPVTFKVEKGMVRAILKKVLGEQELTYIIKEGGIHVTTPERAAKFTVLRFYSIEDWFGLVNPIAQPWLAKQARMQAAQQLIRLIQQFVEPDYWHPNGPGTITYFDPTQSLLIRASAEIHFQFMAPPYFHGR